MDSGTISEPEGQPARLTSQLLRFLIWRPYPLAEVTDAFLQNCSIRKGYANPHEMERAPASGKGREKGSSPDSSGTDMAVTALVSQTTAANIGSHSSNH